MAKYGHKAKKEVEKAMREFKFLRIDLFHKTAKRVFRQSASRQGSQAVFAAFPASFQSVHLPAKLSEVAEDPLALL